MAKVAEGGADFRLRDGWIKSLEGHLAGGGKAAVVQGLGGGLLKRGPTAVLVERRRLEDGRGVMFPSFGPDIPGSAGPAANPFPSPS